MLEMRSYWSQGEARGHSIHTAHNLAHLCSHWHQPAVASEAETSSLASLKMEPGTAPIRPDIQTISGSGAVDSQSYLSEIFSLLLIETLFCVVLSLWTWTACLSADRSVASQASLCSGFLP